MSIKEVGFGESPVEEIQRDPFESLATWFRLSSLLFVAVERIAVVIDIDILEVLQVGLGFDHSQSLFNHADSMFVIV